MHFALAKNLIENDISKEKLIEEHLIRSYDMGDKNYEAKHVHAQFLFFIGKLSEAEEIFGNVHANAPP